MIPFADMCNHEEGYASITYDAATDSVGFVTTRQVKQGHEFKISYGAGLTSEVAAVKYGFLMPETRPRFDYPESKLSRDVIPSSLEAQQEVQP